MASVPPAKRGPVPTAPANLALLDMLSPALATAFKTEDRAQYDYAHTIVSLAVAEFSRAHQRLPSDSELAALLGEPALLIDPNSGKPFQITPLKSGEEGALPFQIWSGETLPKDEEESKGTSPPL